MLQANLVVSRFATVKCALGRSIPRGVQKSHGLGQPCRRAKSMYNEGGSARHARRRYAGILIFLGSEKGPSVIPLTNGCLLHDASWQTEAIGFARSYVKGGTGDVDEKEGEYRRLRTNRLAMLCTRRNGREKEYAIFPRERERGNEGLAGSSPRSFAMLCRRNKLLGFVARYGRRFRSLVFAIIAVTAALAPGVRPTGPTTRFRRYYSRIIATEKYGDDLPGGIGWLAWCEMWRTTSEERHRSQTLAYRDERVPHIARVLRSPTLNRVRGAPLIWVAGQSTTTTATFQDSDSPLLFSTRRIAYGRLYSFGKKIIVQCREWLRPINGTYLVHNIVTILIFRYFTY